MPTASIRVEGLDQFRRGLRRIDSDLGKELGRRNRDVGTEVARLVDRKVSMMSGRFPAYRSNIVRITPSSNQRQVQVTVRPAAAETGADRHPVFGRWVDQNRFRRRVWPKKLPRGQGLLVRPTVEENEADIAEIYLAAVTSLARQTIGA